MSSLGRDTPLGLRLASPHPAEGAWFWLSKVASNSGSREAIVDGSRRVTYGELRGRSERLAAALERKHGIRPGDRVAVLTSNRTEWVELYFATARLGAILVPLNFRLAPPELKYQLQDCGVRLLLIGPEHAELASRVDLELGARIHLGAEYEALIEGASASPPEAPPAAFNDPHVILYTSGTTGRAKGAVLTHANLFWNCVNVALAFGLCERDTTLTFLPLFHAGGMGLHTLPTLHVGGRVVLMRAFESEAICTAIEREQVTSMFGVPATWLDLLKRPDFERARYPTLRSLGTGGAPCPMTVIDQLGERGFPVLQGYGLTETAPGGTLISPEDWKRKAGTVGKPMRYVELKVVDEQGRTVAPGEVGECWFRGPNVFAGYWGRPEATTEAFSPEGWFKSGDLGTMDAEGFFTLVDRKKDMIISGGENVYSAEVEDSLFEHPSVAEAAVIGIADPKWGEVVHAVVALRPGKRTSPDDLIQHCKSRLAKYKVPKAVTFVDALPRNASGKVLKPELRRLYGTSRT